MRCHLLNRISGSRRITMSECMQINKLIMTVQFGNLDLAGADMIRQRMTQLLLTVLLPPKLLPTAAFMKNYS